MTPLRKVKPQGNGEFIIEVTPPPMLGLPPSNVRLDADQYLRYKLWLSTTLLIQDVLGDLSAEDREILMTGIGQETWIKLFSNEEKHDEHDDNQ